MDFQKIGFLVVFFGQLLKGYIIRSMNHLYILYLSALQTPLIWEEISCKWGYSFKKETSGKGRRKGNITLVSRCAESNLRTDGGTRLPSYWRQYFGAVFCKKMLKTAPYRKCFQTQWHNFLMYFWELQIFRCLIYVKLI